MYDYRRDNQERIDEDCGDRMVGNARRVANGAGRCGRGHCRRAAPDGLEPSDGADAAQSARQKGALRAEMVDGRNIYRAKMAQSQCVRQESRSFLNRVFEGDAGRMLVHFVQNEKITPEQIKELKALLNAKQQDAK